jgi:uncharacterized protein (DUF433 family)
MPGPRRARTIPAGARSDVVRRYQAGETMAQIAAVHDVSPATVRALLVEENVPIRRQGGYPSIGSVKERTAEIVRLRQVQRLTLQAIGDRYQLTRERVRQILKAEGVDPRFPYGDKPKA